MRKGETRVWRPPAATATYTIVKHRLKSVFQLFLESVALQNVNDANVEKESLALFIASGNATGSIR
mgnify:CR=1 FL=1